MKAKKIFKGMTAAAIAAVLAASMVPMTAFAAVTSESKTITVNTASGYENVTGSWTAYKVATATPNGNAYDYEWVTSLDTIVTSLPTIAEISNTTWTDAQTKALAAKITKALNDNSTFANNLTQYTKALGTTDNLEPGYYVFVITATKDNGGVKEGLIIEPVLREVSDKNFTNVTAKFKTVTVDKSITGITDGSKDASGNIAEGTADSVVSYEIKADFPTYDDDVKTSGSIEDFIIADQPGANLSIITSTIKVYEKNGSTEIPATSESGANYTLDSADTNASYGGKNSGTGFKITFDDAYVLNNQGSGIVVKFDATIAGTGAIETAIPNDVQLDYGNNYSTGGGKVTLKDETDVYKTQLKVAKTKSDSSALAGAGFKIYSADIIRVGEEYKKITDIADFSTNYTTDTDGFIYAKSDTNKATVLNQLVGNEKVTTDVNNILTWNLPAGKYIIHESTVPTNYKQAENREVTITATANREATAYTYTKTGLNDDTTNTATIINYEGQTLPGTGGVGTTIFTIAGVGVVLVAGAMLVVYMRKRRTEDEE